MVRYRAIVAYDGTGYQGYQIQGELPTIQYALEQALGRILETPTGVIGAGRTDAGVHASGQVIAFDANWRHTDEALLKALNVALPQDIAVQSIRQQAGFHPRFDALSRTYRYDVAETGVRQPLLQHRTWQVPPVIDREKLHQAAALLIGKHDFATFGTPPKGENTVRLVYGSSWSEQPAHYGALLSYRIEATAFLKHMVRRIVSTLVAVGQGWMTLEMFEQAFRQANLKYARPPAPPQGLFLESVRYSD